MTGTAAPTHRVLCTFGNITLWTKSRKWVIRRGRRTHQKCFYGFIIRRFIIVRRDMQFVTCLLKARIVKSSKDRRY
jgi:hypothetical protein